MYPHPELNSYLQGLNHQVSRRILNRVVNRAMHERSVCEKFQPHVYRVASTQPQCFAPDVDVSQAKCGFRQFALPKLLRDLKSDDALVVKQAVTTLADLVVDPEKSIKAVNMKITDRLTDFLISDDPHLRERSAMIFATLANQAAGREAILNNLSTLANLSQGLEDRSSSVRLTVATIIELLARDYRAANQLNACGFAESISAKLCGEKREILLHYLDTLRLLLLPEQSKKKVIETGVFEKLIELLKRKDEQLLCKVLSCLGALCEDEEGKKKSIERNLLCILRKFLQDKRESLVNTEAARVASLVTITTAGKLSALKMGLTTTLLHLALHKCASVTLQLPIIKTLSNIAEAPEGRRIFLEKYMTLVESMNVGCDEMALRHKQTLLDIIRWQP